MTEHEYQALLREALDKAVESLTALSEVIQKNHVDFVDMAAEMSRGLNFSLIDALTDLPGGTLVYDGDGTHYCKTFYGDYFITEDGTVVYAEELAASEPIGICNQYGSYVFCESCCEEDV